MKEGDLKAVLARLVVLIRTCGPESNEVKALIAQHEQDRDFLETAEPLLLLVQSVARVTEHVVDEAPELKEALTEFIELARAHGPESSQVVQCMQRHAGLEDFTDLANQLHELMKS